MLYAIIPNRIMCSGSSFFFSVFENRKTPNGVASKWLRLFALHSAIYFDFQFSYRSKIVARAFRCVFFFSSSFSFSQIFFPILHLIKYDKYNHFDQRFNLILVQCNRKPLHNFRTVSLFEAFLCVVDYQYRKCYFIIISFVSMNGSAD